MSQPFVGEIRMFGGNFAPQGWANCDGSALPISQNTVLFNLIGTTYGGDGQNTFNLPDLLGRAPLHADSVHVQGEKGGAETVTLTVNQIPSHSHPPQAVNKSGTDNPSSAYWAASTAKQFSTAGPTGAMNPASIGTIGGSQPHDNMVPFLAVSFIISLFGIYPSQ